MTKIESWLGVGLVLLVAGCGESSKKKSSGDGGSSSKWMAAVGAQGTFVQTFDQQHWSSRALTTSDLYSVTCVGSLDGWAAGANGFVSRTEDGGQSWQQADAHTQAVLRSIHWSKLEIGTTATLYAALITEDLGGDFLAGANGTVVSNSGSGFVPTPTGTGATLYGLEDLGPS